MRCLAETVISKQQFLELVGNVSSDPLNSCDKAASFLLSYFTANQHVSFAPSAEADKHERRLIATQIPLDMRPCSFQSTRQW